MGRDRYASQSLGSLHGEIKKSRILMVGAGGIGCELLKNLVLTGFGEIHIVDLDTIDLSNLNRQFLFRSEHIKKSKALVAKESAGKFNPNVHIEAYHANIKDPTFNIPWFKTFRIVFNALDNLEARRHVNKMCLAADVPLIESGTTGFNGQVQPIKRGITKCYDCDVKVPPKSFAVCTIRSTPSQPIHCTVWGKSYLFAEIFGTSEENAPEMNMNEDVDNASEIQNLQKEAQALQRIRESMGSVDFPRLVFNKVFKEDVERLRSMEDMWKSRRMPEPLDFDTLAKEAESIPATVAQQDQKVWSLAENMVVFVDSLKRLSDRLTEERAKGDLGNAAPVLTFDKDDVDTLDFVAASANLRSHVFGIEMKSKFDIKQMAGNIIPAIATTNAMTAGLCVLQAFKVMRNEMDKAKMLFLKRGDPEKTISIEPLGKPNPNCPVCSVARTTVTVDPSATLNSLVEALKSQLSYGEEISIQTEDGQILYDPEEDAMLDKTFIELNLKDQSIEVVDDEEKPRVNLVLTISVSETPLEGPAVQVPSGLQIPRKPDPPAKEETAEATNGHATPFVVGLANGKRKRDEQEAVLEGEIASKRGKVAPAADDEVVVLDDAGDGAILIED